MKKKYRCFALFSGGLDSMLAVLHMDSLGYDVLPVFFRTPFFGPGNALKAAEHIGFNLLVIDITTEHIEMLKNPRYGFGKNMNPCIDCHGLMLRKAGELMRAYNVDFIISGEVLGQRPMSQRADALNAVGKLSRINDLLIRPLSQRLLSDTLPVREGWIKREDMLDLHGRGRKAQMELAGRYGITFYHNPGGGCLLTDKAYSNRLRDLQEHDMLNEKQIRLLNIGRHFRINENIKIVVGKNSLDNERLNAFVEDQIVMQAESVPGPLGIIISRKRLKPAELELVASLLLRYSNKAPDTDWILYGEGFSLAHRIQVTKMRPEQVAEFLIQ